MEFPETFCVLKKLKRAFFLSQQRFYVSKLVKNNKVKSFFCQASNNLYGSTLKISRQRSKFLAWKVINFPSKHTPGRLRDDILSAKKKSFH